MNKNIAVALLAGATVFGLQAQAQPGIQWERSFGGSDADFSHVSEATSDGGCIIGGYSYSDVSGSKTSASFGSGDFWVVKLDASGNKQWDRSCGGTNLDRITSLQQTSDGGYILGGLSFSAVSGNKTSAHHGAADYWVVKLGPAGNKQWDKSYGGSSNDLLRSVQPADDGGYILGGVSLSGVSGNKSSASFGSDDYWIVKLNASGNKQWEKTYGGSDSDELHALQPTGDGGCIIGGYSFSGVSGNKTSANFGNGASDYWIVKLDASGNKQWEKSYGGDDADELYSLQQTADGGFILGGHSYSDVSGNKSSGSFGSHDYWVVKLDAGGNKQWDKSYGGDDSDHLHSVQQTIEGGYILGGLSSSRVSANKLTTSASAQSGDYWVVKLAANGNKQWEQSIPGSHSGEVLRLQSTADGSYLLAGVVNSAAAEADYTAMKFRGALQLYSFSIRPDRVFQAQLIGMPGSNYALQSSIDFTTWTSRLTNHAVNGLVTFAGTNSPGFSRLFYRAIQVP
ncbi:MAG TPA: T9SS C-terminal target domain-containing protein [Methylomirabilota bacterium]|nr:T9SS C-terminal target domain-containing protein [Methylomirabilota bacterium]